MEISQVQGSSIRYQDTGIGDASIALHSGENRDKKLSQLTAKNDELRSQLIKISKELGDKLKKKKPTDIFKNQ